MIKKMYWLIAMILICSVASSQECNITFKGKVNDFHDGTPIFNAIVQIENTNRYVETDLQGNFVLKNLCNKSYWIIISHI